MTQTDTEATAAIARFVLGTPVTAIPEAVRGEGVRSLVNIVGCTLGGARHDAVARAWSALSPFAGAAHASLVGRSEKTDALTAALINTLASSVNTYDDTHAEAIVHPSGPVMAAALAVAEMRTVTGAEFLAAFTLGVEATCRLSKALSVAPAKSDIGWSQTGIACGIGAALAASRLMDLDLAATRVAVGIAASQASGIRALHGTHCTPLMPANAGQSGLRAAILAKAGITSSPSVIEQRYGLAACFAESPHLAYLTDGLGERYEILGNTYKPYPCGIVIHPLIDAALALARDHAPSPEAIVKVAVSANPAAMALCFRRHPKDEFEGQVSLFQWVAAALVRGRAGLSEGTDAAIADPVIAALRDRIEVTTTPDVPHDGADMTLALRDGTLHQVSVRDCIGSKGRPMSDAELDGKFRDAASATLDAAKAAAVLACVRDVEALSDASHIAQATQP